MSKMFKKILIANRGIVMRICLAGASVAIAPAAEACRVPNDPELAQLQRQRQHKESAKIADVILKGRLFDRSKDCDSTRHCGQWIKTVRVLKGTPAPYYLIDTEEFLIVCSREFVKPGKIGTFHLQAEPGGTYLILDDIR